MEKPSTALLQAVTRVARTLSEQQVQAVANAVASMSGRDGDGVRSSLQTLIPQPMHKGVLSSLAAEWAKCTISATEIASMLRAASHSVQAERMDQVVELVWTGPQQAAGTFRRIDQALCELIDSAQSSILIVSFAVYMVPSVATALHRAAQRGVVIDICIEAPEPGGNQVAYDTVAALGSAVRAVSAVYVWPAANRPTAANGSLAALHAKCAVADESTLLVSSANLTNHALSMNLELGLVVRGGALPNRVAEYFRGLIQAGVLISHEQLT